MLGHLCPETDARIAAGKPFTPGFLFAALLWEPVLHESEVCTARGMSDLQAYDAAGTDLTERQIQHVSLPCRFSHMVRELWALQPRLVNWRGRGAASPLLAHPRFRVAYDFLLPRAESGEDVAEHAQWWTRLQEAEDGERRSMLEDRRGRKTTAPMPRHRTPGADGRARDVSSQFPAVEHVRWVRLGGPRSRGAGSGETMAEFDTRYMVVEGPSGVGKTTLARRRRRTRSSRGSTRPPR